MNELKIIENNYNILRKNLEIRYSPLPCPPSPSSDTLKNYRQHCDEKYNQYVEESKKLEAQYRKDIEVFEQKENEKLSKMTNRQLLEEIYKILNRL